MTQWRFVKVAHSKNTILNRRLKIEGMISIIRACRRAGEERRSAQSVGVLLLDPIDVELKVAEVILTDVKLEHFVDDGKQVMKRSDRLERNGVGRAEDAA